MQKLDPLFIPFLHDRFNNFGGNITNAIITGFEDMEIIDIKYVSFFERIFFE